MDKPELTDHERALELIAEGSISKMKGNEEDGFYHVVGSNDEYLVVLPDFCTCEQFILRCINNPGDVCYHILAVQMSGKIDRTSDEDWRKLLLKHH
jgi:predicted nucleic acid-binding Zn finger protein